MDTSGNSTTTVSVTEIPYEVYDVIFYFDGDSASRSGDYRTDDGNGLVSLTNLRDTANFNLAGGGSVFTQAINSGDAGNFGIFASLTGSSFTFSASPNNTRGPLNGLQIIDRTPAIPEPTTAVLLGLGAMGIMRRRRLA